MNTLPSAGLLLSCSECSGAPAWGFKMRGGLTLGSSTLSPADFFQGKHFFLYGEFPGDERRKLSRYVTAFNGSVRRGGGRGREGRCYLVGGKASGSQRRGTHAGWARVAFPLLLISKMGLSRPPF